MNQSPSPRPSPAGGEGVVARTLLIRGMLAGLAAGLLAFVFAWIVGEPAVSSAISFETQRAAAEGAAPYVPIVSRDVQSTLGLLTAVVVYGVALGGIFSLVFAGIYGRLRRTTPTRTAIELAAAAFVVVYLVPFLKYPANPPAVGQPDTIQLRTTLYLVMMAVSVPSTMASCTGKSVSVTSVTPAGMTTVLLMFV